MKILDNRIHFALNCGAESCPPVLFYTADNINVELNIATNNFVNSSEVKYDKSRNSLHISKIFHWYKGDFGGKSGVVDLLKKFKAIPMDVNKPSI